jgi:DNA-binding MarR family transcriptional regulator
MSTRSAAPFGVTLDVRDRCLCLHLQRAARAVARRFDEALKPAGLTSGQFSLMMAMNRAEPPTIGHVSASLGMDRTTLTANLKPLERKGFVRVTVDAEDRRGRLLSLTTKGRAALASAVPLWRKTQDEMDRAVARMSPDRLREALRALA